MFALIFEDKVAEISEEKFPVAKSMKWVECDDQVQAGWFYVNKKFRLNLLSDEENLEITKRQKISKLKKDRDQKNTEPISEYKAFLLDSEGKKTLEESYFLFYTHRHQVNPTSDPDSIINRTIEMGSMPYFTKDIQGNKITIELTAELARSLRQVIANHNDLNYRNASEAEAKIKAANTIQEVEAVLS